MIVKLQHERDSVRSQLEESSEELLLHKAALARLDEQVQEQHQQSRGGVGVAGVAAGVTAIAAMSTLAGSSAPQPQLVEFTPDFTQDRESLQQEIQALEAELEVAREVHTDKAEFTPDFTLERESLEQKIQTLEAELEAAREVHSENVEFTTDFTLEQESLKQKIQALEAELEAAREVHNEQVTHNKAEPALDNGDLDRGSLDNGGWLEEETHQQRALPGQDVPGRHKIIASLEEVIQGHQATIASLEEKIQGHDESNADLEEIQSLGKTIASLEEKIQGQQSTIASLEESLQHIGSSESDKIASLEEKIQGQQETIASLEESLQHVGSSESDQIASLEEKIQGQQETIASLEESLQHVGSSESDKIASLAEELQYQAEEYSAKVEDLEAELSQSCASLASMQSQMAAQVEEASQKLAATTFKGEQLHKQVDRLTEELASARAAESQIAQLQHQSEEQVLVLHKELNRLQRQGSQEIDRAAYSEMSRAPEELNRFQRQGSQEIDRAAYSEMSHAPEAHDRQEHEAADMQQVALQSSPMEAGASTSDVVRKRASHSSGGTPSPQSETVIEMGETSAGFAITDGRMALSHEDASSNSARNLSLEYRPLMTLTYMNSARPQLKQAAVVMDRLASALGGVLTKRPILRLAAAAYLVAVHIMVWALLFFRQICAAPV
eukprot:gene24067-9642_t